MSRNQPNHQTMQYGALVCAILTAVIHIYLSFQIGDRPDLIFLLNGIGYLVLVSALYLPWAGLSQYKSAIRWLLIGYAALTIVLWIFLGARTFVGYVDKLLEIALIIFLWLDSQLSP
ncbi:MAG: hypothetical protein R2932_48940 [Caldilineaceae bacterium]